MNEHLKNIALFVEIARAGSFTLASKTLHIPLSTLSRRFSDFEKSIGLKLINRDTRKLELTSVGADYFAECSRLVDEAAIAHERLLETRSSPAGRLKISMTPDFGTSMFSPLLVTFAQRYPAISFDLDLTSATVDLIANNIDVAIRFGSPPDSSSVMRSLGKFQHGIYATPAYLAREGTPLAPDQLKGHQCIRLSHATKAKYDQIARDGQIHPIIMRERFQSNSIGLLRNLALASLGIAIMPEIVARQAVSERALVRILPEWHFEPTPILALTSTRLLSAACRAFLEFLDTQIPELFKPE